jgi:4-amino-4-deoxy-L-arabinose transferase-like glycosyltransferase
MMPWSGFIWKAWPRRNAEEGREEGEPAVERYVATWATVVFIFFAISGAKLVHYILPMCPPLAILVGSWAARVTKRVHLWMNAGLASCAAVFVIANGVFLWWFGASGQAEAQAMARYVRAQGGKVALYQLGRRNKDLGTGKAKLQETSLPSLVMVLDLVALESDSMTEISKGPTPTWIITRSNRIRPEDFIAVQRSGHVLLEQRPPIPQANFKLYMLK